MGIAYDGQYYENEYDLEAGRPVQRADTEGKTHITVTPSTDSTIPAGSPEKPADAFNSEEGTTLPAPDLSSPEPSQSVTPDYVNPPEGSRIPGMIEGIGKVLKGVGEGLWQPIQTFHDVRTGKIPFYVINEVTGESVINPEVIKASTDLGGLAITGPIPAVVAGKAVPEVGGQVLGSFAGANKSFKYLNGTLDSNSIWSNGKYEVNINHLNNKQLSDFIELQERFKGKKISRKDYELELAEYHQYSANKKSNIVKTKEYFEQVPFPYTTQEWKTFDSDLKKSILNNPVIEQMKEFDYFLKQPNLTNKIPIKDLNETSPMKWKDFNTEVEKLSPKEAFKQGILEARENLKIAFSEIANKMKTAIRGPLGNQVRSDYVSPRADYTDPVYRGMTVYGGNELNSVHHFHKSGNMYSTSNPMLADMYAGYLNSHPGIKVPEGTFSEGAQILPLLINPKDYHYFDAKGGHWQKANPKAIEEANKLGKKGVIVDNVWDEPNSTHALGIPNKIYITFPEGATTVKSRAAKNFDPSSADMMNSIAAIGIGGSAGYLSFPESSDDRK